MGYQGEQLAIAFEPRSHARRTDPGTSHEAAALVKEFASGHCAVILGALRSYGHSTIDEIAKRTELTAVQVARRLPDLQKAGKAEPTGEERLSASGRSERVWMVCCKDASNDRVEGHDGLCHTGNE